MRLLNARKLLKICLHLIANEFSTTTAKYFKNIFFPQIKGAHTYGHVTIHTHENPYIHMDTHTLTKTHNRKFRISKYFSILETSFYHTTLQLPNDYNQIISKML